jgi:hypothetical protein
VRIIEVSTPGHFLANTSATCFFIYSAEMENAFAVPNHQCSFRAALVVAHFFSRGRNSYALRLDETGQLESVSLQSRC